MTQPPEFPDQPPSAQPPPPPGYGAPPPQQPGYGAPPVGYGPPAGPVPGGQLSPQEERTWAMLAHLSAIIASIVFLSFLGPLIVMLVQGPKSPMVRRQAVEALNFQITTYIAAIISAILIIVIVGFVLLAVVGVLWLVFTILAAVKANNGEDYRYPINWRLVK